METLSSRTHSTRNPDQNHVIFRHSCFLFRSVLHSQMSLRISKSLSIISPMVHLKARSPYHLVHKQNKGQIGLQNRTCFSLNLNKNVNFSNSQSANYSSQNWPINIDSLLRELNSLPPLDDLPNFDDISLDPHIVFSSPSEQRGVSSEKSSSGFLGTAARSHLKAASHIENSDDTASSRLLEWRKPGVELRQANSGVFPFLLE